MNIKNPEVDRYKRRWKPTIVLSLWQFDLVIQDSDVYSDEGIVVVVEKLRRKMRSSGRQEAIGHRYIEEPLVTSMPPSRLILINRRSVDRCLVFETARYERIRDHLEGSS
jgi:hypothetical protein